MSKIKVALRVRPLSSREREEKYPIVVQVENNSAFITDIRVPEKPAADSRQRFRQFEFDHAFWLTECSEWGASQEEVYNEMAPALERSILQGYNACLLAYGQSGTGKTHTMLGTKTDPGLIPRLCHSLWEKLRQGRENSSCRMEVSFMEIYREKVRDLLTPDKPLKLREHPQNGPHVQDLTRVEVTEKIGLVDLLWEGERRRAIGTTGSNRRSSRSHAIWTLYLSYRDGPDYQNLITNQVHLVDLAGSEKADLTATKNLLAEGADINRSLVSLGNVISSLAEKQQHIPYRDSALTWLLKDSLGGNANTSIIITASPSSCCHAQTLNSFRFAQRARLVENKPEVNLTSCSQRNSDSYLASIFDIRKDISRLANILKVAQNNGGILRGLTPRNGWNRLISAIESWNNVQEKYTRRASTASTTSASTMTNAASKTLNHVMVQADLTDEIPEKSTSSSSVPASPCKARSESPCMSNSNSGSIKCLTWSQSEVESIPPPPPSESEEDEVVPSPSSNKKVHHMKYIIPVHFPTTHNIEGEARITETIRRSFNFDRPKAERVTPTFIPDPFSSNRLLIREQLPTLVNPQKLEIFENNNSSSESSSSNPNSPSGDFAIAATSPMFRGSFDSDKMEEETFSGSLEIDNPQPHFVLARGTGRRRTHRVPPKIKEFAVPKAQELYLFESTDEGEFSDCLEVELNQSGNKNYRTVDFESQVHINDTPTPPFTSLEYYTDSSESNEGSGKSSSSEKKVLQRSNSSSSSSSYESLVIQKPVKPVKVVQNSVASFPDDHVRDVTPDDFKILERHVTAVSYGEPKELETKLSEAEETEDGLKEKKPVDGSSQTAFQNFYRRELHQLDAIGQQIKSLQHLAQRYDVLKPYLKKIEELQNQDFTQPDPEIDPLIEHCSGWNMDIEFRKVQNEVVAISKMLKNNSGAKIPGLPTRRDSSSASNRSHRTSSTSLTTSDSYSLQDPNSRRGSCASTYDLPKPKYPSLISTFTISSDLDVDGSISLSTPNSSMLSFNVSQSLSQSDVSNRQPAMQNTPRKFNIPPDLAQPPALNFDYGRYPRRDLPPWSPQTPPHHPFGYEPNNTPTNPGFYPAAPPPTSDYYYNNYSSSTSGYPYGHNYFNGPEGSQPWRPSYPMSPPEFKGQFYPPYSFLNGTMETHPQHSPVHPPRYSSSSSLNGSKNGYSPPHNLVVNPSSPPQQPSNPNVWSPPVTYPSSPPKIMNGMKVDPYFGYQQQQRIPQSPPSYHEYYSKGIDPNLNYSPPTHPFNHTQTSSGSRSPFRSLSMEGEFGNLSSSSTNNICKSCAMEFCSCQDSLSSKVPSDYISMPSKVSPVQVKSHSRRPSLLRSGFGSYNSQFSP